MTNFTTQIGGTVRRVTLLAIPLLVTTTGTVAAHGSGGSRGSMMSGGWGLFGGAMGLWGLLWMGLLIGVPLYLVFTLANRDGDETTDHPQAVLRERYAGGDISEEEFERQREQLDRAG